MPNYNISLNPQLAKIVETQIKTKKYASRSEFFRDLVRRQYVEQARTIEELTFREADYKLVQKRKSKAHFIPLKDLLTS